MLLINVEDCVILSGLKCNIAMMRFQTPRLHVAGTKIEPVFVLQFVRITYHKVRGRDVKCIYSHNFVMNSRTWNLFSGTAVCNGIQQ